MNEEGFENIKKECKRIEEDVLYSGKGHHNAASLWSWAHYIIGIPMTICAGWAGINAFSDDPEWSGYLALVTAALAAVQTFMGANDKSVKHKNAGDKFFDIKNRARFCREIDLDDSDKTKAVEKVRALDESRNVLNGVSPPIPNLAYWLAQRAIEKKQAQYEVDKGD